MPGVAPGDLASISERQAEAGAQIGGHAGAEPQTVAVERRPVDAEARAGGGGEAGIDA